MIKIAVNGALGRMGARIIALAKEQPSVFDVTQVFDLKNTESLAPYATGEKKLACDVLIDFSGPEGMRQCIAAARASKKALIVGSTGYSISIFGEAQTASKEIPLIVSSNMSIGVNVVLALLDVASKKLPGDFKIQMSEAHHVHKKDRPSGTALMLARQIADSRSVDFNQLSKTIEVIREGEIVGDHSVIFESGEELIEIRHHAKTRDVFARGALTAACFAASAKPGLYSMADALKG
jgi:4-hydroxy-tetrahydrodipicolinate reductase